jgi:hypothetical protein
MWQLTTISVGQSEQVATRFCLNYDTDKASELEHEIDALIAELQALKLEVPKRFQQWNAMYERNSKRGE